MGNYNTSDPEAVAIRKKIEKLISIDPTVEIYDVISIEEVEKFEIENDVILPEDYVWFITNVGNGGIWMSSYRFYPLGYAGFSCEELPGHYMGMEKYSLPVFSTGCTYGISIILEGEHFGELAYDADEMAVYHPMIVHGFKEFYLKWLDEACLGYDGYGVENRRYGTIEENLKQYKIDRDLAWLRAIYSKVNSKCATEQFVSAVRSTLKSEKNKNKENRELLIGILEKIKSKGHS